MRSEWMAMNSEQMTMRSEQTAMTSAQVAKIPEHLGIGSGPWRAALGTRSPAVLPLPRRVRSGALPGQAEPAKPYGPRRLRIPRKIGPGVRADGSGRRLGVQSSRIPLGATAPRAVAPSGHPSLRRSSNAVKPEDAGQDGTQDRRGTVHHGAVLRMRAEPVFVTATEALAEVVVVVA